MKLTLQYFVSQLLTSNHF